MKDLRVYLAVAAALLLVYLVAEYNKPQPIDWSPSYQASSKMPFGTWILHERLPDLFRGRKPRDISRTFSETLDVDVKSGNYIAVAPAIDPSKTDFDAAVRFIKKGANLFIATSDYGNVLKDSLKIEVGYPDVASGDHTALRFTDPKLRRTRYQFSRGVGGYHYEKYDTARAEILSRDARGRATFLRYRYGRGALYLLSDPRLLSNYVLQSKAGSQYAETVLSYLPAAAPVHWDSYFNEDGSDDLNLSPMRVIFRYAPLRNAYLVAVVSLLVYVVFGMKRRQRVIPVTDPMRNTSAEFVNVIGQVYYQQRDNLDLAKKNIAYLLEYVRSRYRIDPNHDDDFEALLVKRTGIPESHGKRLAGWIGKIGVVNRVTDTELLQLNTLIEDFYTNA